MKITGRWVELRSDKDLAREEAERLGEPVDRPLPGVTEYCEGYPVALCQEEGSWIIWAQNEGGYNGTEVDAVELLEAFGVKDAATRVRRVYQRLAQAEGAKGK